MLSELLIQNLAIVQQSHIEFDQSFNLMTGETGAGKSILIKALRILSGLSRAPKEMVRTGASHALISAIWALPDNHPSSDLLEHYGLCNEENTLHLRRKISPSGKHSAYINDTPVRTETLTEIAKTLIDFTGQHSSFELKQQHHTDILDQQICNKALKNYRLYYKKAQEALQNTRETFEQAADWQQQQEQYKQKIQEFENLNPSSEDYEHLRLAVKSAMSRESQKHVLSQTQQLLQSGSQMHQVSNILSDEKEFTELANDAKQIASLFDDLSYSVSTRVAKLNSSSHANSEQLQSRIANYQRLMRKHQCSDISELMQKHADLSGIYNQICDAPQKLEEMIDQLDRLCQQLLAADTAVHSARLQIAKKIDQKVTVALKNLSMPKAVFKTISETLEPKNQKFKLPNLDPAPCNTELFTKLESQFAQYHSQGSQYFYFHISSNPGQPLQKMSQVASGGESSRVLLAIKSILSAHGPQNTFVFDEIDTGVSGGVAHQMGQLISKISKNVQVLCISHSPQIASWADTHFKVEKSFQKDSTQSKIHKLNHKERIQEIALFLSGSATTPESIKNAKQLLEAQHQSL